MKNAEAWEQKYLRIIMDLSDVLKDTQHELANTQEQLGDLMRFRDECQQFRTDGIGECPCCGKTN